MSEGLKTWVFAWVLALTLAPAAFASSELDHQFALHTVGFLRSWDNMDQLFSDYVSSAYRDYFSRQNRFVLQDMGKADEVLSHSKLPYYKIIEDPEILAQLTKATRSESVIRTKIRKEGAQYVFDVEWLHAPHMDVMARDEFSLTDVGDVKSALEHGLARTIAKVPFKGEVTGRDAGSVTLNIGANAGVHLGDTLVISTLDEIKKHPLLHEIVDWRFTQTGKVLIDQVDDDISFGHVVEEVEGHQVTRGQKITQVIPKPVAIENSKSTTDANGIEQSVDDQPHLGWVTGGLSVGPYSRQFSETTGTNWNGGGFSYGAAAKTEIWLTREFFVQAALGYRAWTYGQSDASSGTASPATAAGGTAASQFSFDGAVGYTYFVDGDTFGTKGSLKLGYSSNSYTLPISTAEITSPTLFWAFYLGLSGDLPIRGPWGAHLDLDFGIINGAGQNGLTSIGQPTGASYIHVYAGATYRYLPRMVFKLGIDVLSNGASFATAQISQNTVAIVPAVMYYF